jgi:pyridoxal biosynthesis lyase PdxS
MTDRHVKVTPGQLHQYLQELQAVVLLDADVLARVSQGLGDAMSGLSTATLAPEELLETRGW